MANDEPPTAAPANVLLVVDNDTHDRMNVVVRHLCVGMMDEPIRMRVLAWTRHPVSDDRIGPVTVSYPPKRAWGLMAPDPDALTEALGDPVPDIVHCLSADSAARMGDYVTAWGAHLIVHLTDAHDLRAFGRLTSREDVTAVPTTGVLDRLLRKRYPDARSDARTIPLGLPAASEPACLSRPERVPAFVVTGNLTRDCGLDLLLYAWRDVVMQGQETQLFILGQGSAERHFRRLMERLDLRSHVTFAGEMGSWASLSEAMRGADFYVVPAPPERFTMGTLYAMALGLTVIASTGLIEDYVIDGQTARLFDPGRHGDLCEKIVALLNDHQSARRLAHGGQDYVRSHHQASAMVRDMAALYRDKCEERKTPPDDRPGKSLESAAASSS